MPAFSRAPVMASKPVASTMLSASWWAPSPVRTPVGVIASIGVSRTSTRVTLSRLKVS
ncbi:MAG: hypothetical protein AVDCRST_MAG04-852 [uncultured Acetobacteraceae bacterium]|uniref:Uncharacterized protein n=1 Tax=uncultured Acetobacteraceae bacterium TaxID=169975 RepID=A0A6J4HJK5_9PROT|nr:MAG: hypothetical protein AVDCRST_MAG04-852 [uncultured Acetobacteraceae bacterium]